MKPIHALLLICCLSLGSWSAHGTGIERLKAFIQGTRSAQAEFTQTVLDSNKRRTQEASGTMQFVRPGKFRWTYAKPYEQLIVGDGAKLWIYDRELNQVTVRNLDQAIGSSPAALLSGSNEIERDFTLTEAGSKDGLLWLEAIPKTKETNFARVRMGFDAQGMLAAMELHDPFGQTTVLRFSGLKKNPRLAADLFKFTPPKGVDVIGE